MRVRMAIAGVCALGFLGAAQAPAPAPAPPVGYLAASPIDTYRILPPAPVAGTPRYEADRTVFKDTRKLEGGPRWKLAQNDDNSAAIMKDLSCALGVEITARNAPTLAVMIPRIGRDSAGRAYWPDRPQWRRQVHPDEDGDRPD